MKEGPGRHHERSGQRAGRRLAAHRLKKKRRWSPPTIRPLGGLTRAESGRHVVVLEIGTHHRPPES